MIPDRFPTAEELNFHDCRTSQGFGWLEFWRILRRGAAPAARVTAYRVCAPHGLAFCRPCADAALAQQGAPQHEHHPELLTGRGGAKAVRRARRSPQPASKDIVNFPERRQRVVR